MATTYSRFAATIRSVNATDREEVLRVVQGRRSYLLIENRSSNAVYVAFDVTPSSSGAGVEIPSGGIYELENAVPQNAVHIIGDNGSTIQNINITEGFEV